MSQCPALLFKVRREEFSMGDKSQSSKDPKTSISPTLSVRHGRRRSSSTRRRFHPMRRKPRRLGTPGLELANCCAIENESGAVVVQLSVGESKFWVADESALHPAKTAPYGDPALRSTRISALIVWPIQRQGKGIWLARRSDRRSLRTPLGNRQALGRRLTQ